MVKDNPTASNYVAVDITCNVLGDTRRNIEKAFDGEPVKNVMIARYDISYIEQGVRAGGSRGNASTSISATRGRSGRNTPSAA